MMQKLNIISLKIYDDIKKSFCLNPMSNISYLFEEYPQGKMKKYLVKSKWTIEEDQLLKQLVDENDAKNWKLISSFLPNKTPKQCRDHYVNCLSPDIKNSLWTNEEERILIDKYNELGSKWSKIKYFLPGRTTSSIKNYFKVLSCRKQMNINQQSSFQTNEQQSAMKNCMNQERKVPFPDQFYDIEFLLNKPINFV